MLLMRQSWMCVYLGGKSNSVSHPGIEPWAGPRRPGAGTDQPPRSNERDPAFERGQRVWQSPTFFRAYILPRTLLTLDEVSWRVNPGFKTRLSVSISDDWTIQNTLTPLSTFHRDTRQGLAETDKRRRIPQLSLPHHISSRFHHRA